ncbi:Protein of unknown function DUF932 [uncultured Caudovirales phage]|uniref:DUF932 domain-containing protein n=1 Tax=uncultured Caudovirales phage TaxID=2100421 RepID=A0A6J5KWX3_9CAUD|nr:Protein of unknown function DUF932 [uncultured Caudovirales phage]
MMSKFSTQLDSYLTKEQIKEVAPVVFATEPTNKNVSEKYLHVNTETVINDLAKLGWFPVTAMQRRTKPRKDGTPTIRSKHMVSFQNPDLMIKGKNGDDACPRIIVTNSHDGLSSFQFRVGIYRFVCSNGLVVADEEFSAFSIKHKGYTFEELQTVVASAVADLPNKIEVLNKMQARMLTAEEQRQLAIDAMALRSTNPDAKYDEASIEEVLTATRKEDEGDSLWLVFNRVQESIINGGYSAALRGAKVRKVKKIKSFERDLQVNQDLFKLATAFIN